MWFFKAWWKTFCRYKLYLKFTTNHRKEVEHTILWHCTKWEDMKWRNCSITTQNTASCKSNSFIAAPLQSDWYSIKTFCQMKDISHTYSTCLWILNDTFVVWKAQSLISETRTLQPCMQLHGQDPFLPPPHPNPFSHLTLIQDVRMKLIWFNSVTMYHHNA